MTRCIFRIASFAALAFFLGSSAAVAAKDKGTAPAPLFDSGKITAGKARDIEVDVSGAKTLYLVVTDAGDGINSDHANWLNPQFSGAAVTVKLTELKAKSATTGWGKIGTNRSVSGKGLETDGKAFDNGIGIHAPSMLVYDVPKGCTRFTARVGLDAGSRKNGSVSFAVYDSEPPAETRKEAKKTAAVPAATAAAPAVSFLPADTFKVPDDLEISVWATSPMFYNPTNMDIDAAGRVWVAEGVNYRMFKNKIELKHPEGDRIVILEDSDGDGKADKTSVFVQDIDLKSPLGVAVIDNQVIVAQPPDLLVYTDVNRNLKFDEGTDTKERLLSGFGGQDHDHSLHSVTVGADGEWYFNTGNAGTHIVKDKSGYTMRAGSSYSGGSPSVSDKNSPHRGGQAGLVSDDGHIYVGGVAMRMRPDGTGLTVIGHNFRNSYEQTFSSFGDVFQNDNDDPPACRTTWLMEYGNLGFASADGARSWRADQRPGQSVPTAEWRQEDPGTCPAGDVYGNGAPTGIALYENGALGDKYRGLLLSCESARRVVYGYLPVPEGAGFALKRFNFMESNGHPQSSWFRPADVAVGADGAIYVADWFDPGVGGHAMKDGGGSGTIYRIAPKGTPARAPKLDLTSTAGQIDALKSPACNVRYLGFARLKAQGDAAHDAVAALLKDENPYFRARAVWLLSQMGPKGIATVEKLLKDEDAQMRIVAFRALRRQNHQLVETATMLAGDSSPAVRREVALAMRNLSLAQSRDILMKIAQGFDGKDRWYLEAFGTGCDGKEAAIYEALLPTLGGPAKSWDERFDWLAWRLHPPQAVPQFKARALDVTLPKEARDRAVTAIAFNATAGAADAMVAVALNGPEDLRDMAEWWVRNKQNGAWREFDPASHLKAKTPVIAAVAVATGPASQLPPISQIVAMAGHADKGKELFNTRGTCFTCHTAEGKGGQIGPDLSAIGAKFGTEVLLDSMINPSSAIAFGFESTTIVTKDGKTLSGFVVADGDPVIVKDLAGNQQAVDAGNIKSREVMKESIMPSVRNLGLAAQDLADIAAYLGTLKQ